MNEPRFHGAAHSLTLRAIAELASASLPEAADPERTITGIAALDFASPSDLAFFDNSRYAHQLADTRAGICLTSARHAASVPAGTIALIAREPYRAFVAAASVLYPESLRPASTVCGEGISPAAQVSPGAVIEAGVVIDPCAVIGPDAEIGTGTLVGAGAVVGAGVRIGRNCAIGAGSTIT
ncbi:MAG: UDP-3-O-(3-hydroxymyristoyl)glucosamine N-acyltransferase, partial [Rhizobiales bacterium]|nr:UDP-3-O-(3-hydroxymyristoyl)glucosamine N-acyltransferase [Hyphomicrobiales bacterium]